MTPHPRPGRRWSAAPDVPARVFVADARGGDLNHATDLDIDMAHWKKSFPGRYLQVSDLDQPIVATIAGVSTETIGNGDDADDKLVVRFHEDVKACVLNLTRAEAIEGIVGDADTDRWLGKRIKLFRGVTRYQGKRVPCIAIDAPEPDDLDMAMPTVGDDVEF